MDELKKLDLYALLGVPSTAKKKEIKTAYRKKALTCHPDKNPDDPNAAKLFHQLKQILEILLDDASRSSYDKVLKAREANKARTDALDAYRKKLKLDLEEREKQANEKYFSDKQEQERLERLKKQTLDEVTAECERVCREKAERAREKLFSVKRIRIRWKAEKDDAGNGGYNEKNLTEIFSKYGSIEVLVISKKKNGSALLEFSSSEAARRAESLESGFKSNPLTVNVLGSELDVNQVRTNPDVPLNSKKSPLYPAFSSTETQTNASQNTTNFDSFKELVFRRMREAQAKKNLSQNTDADVGKLPE